MARKAEVGLGQREHMLERFKGLKRVKRYKGYGKKGEGRAFVIPSIPFFPLISYLLSGLRINAGTSSSSTLRSIAVDFTLPSMAEVRASCLEDMAD